MTRLVSLAALVIAVMLGGSGIGLAHNTLVNSDPAEGAQLEVGPKQVRLSFDQPARPGYNTVTVVGPGGTFWTGGPARVEGSTITVPVRDLGPAGTYTIGYRILSSDGHPVSGKVTFSLTKPGTGTPAPPPAGHSGEHSAADEGGMPVWPWMAGAGVLAILGLVLALRLGKSARD